jgi:hypothetical protein
MRVLTPFDEFSESVSKLNSDRPPGLVVADDSQMSPHLTPFHIGASIAKFTGEAQSKQRPKSCLAHYVQRVFPLYFLQSLVDL